MVKILHFGDRLCPHHQGYDTSFNHLTWLTAQGDFIKARHHEIFMPYKKV
jgi:hypothetical protein